MAPLPPPLAEENLFASSLLICNSGLSFCVALTSERTELLSGAFCNLEKFAAVGLAGRSECRKTFSSRCCVGFHFRSASICCAGDPAETKQLCVERNRGLPIGGPWAVFTALFANCARSTLSKIENEASSDTASARAVISPRRNTDSKSKRAPVLTRSSHRRFSILVFMSDGCDSNCQMVANYLDHRNRVSS